MFFKVINKKKYTIEKGVLKGSLAFMQHFSWIGEIVVSFFDVINRLKNVSPISSRLQNCIIGDSRNESCQFVKKNNFLKMYLFGRIMSDFIKIHMCILLDKCFMKTRKQALTQPKKVGWAVSYFGGASGTSTKKFNKLPSSKSNKFVGVVGLAVDHHGVLTKVSQPFSEKYK